MRIFIHFWLTSSYILHLSAPPKIFSKVEFMCIPVHPFKNSTIIRDTRGYSIYSFLHKNNHLKNTMHNKGLKNDTYSLNRDKT